MTGRGCCIWIGICFAGLAAACSDTLGIEDPSGRLNDASTTDSFGKSGEADAMADVDSHSADTGADALDGEVDSAVDAGLDGPSEAPGNDGGCPSSAASLSPASVPGLVLWLDAAKGLAAAGQPVPLWSDQSPAHNDASQPNSGLQPVVEGSAIGGLPAIQFNGSTTFLSIADSASLQWGTADYTLLAVARFSIDLGTTSQELFQKTALDAPYPGPELMVNSAVPSQDTKVSSVLSSDVYATSAHDGLNDVPHVFTGRRVGSTVEVRIDGLIEGQAAGALIDISAPGQPAIIGQNGYRSIPGLEAVEGVIAEIVAVKGTISASDLRSLECHMIVKYGL